MSWSMPSAVRSLNLRTGILTPALFSMMSRRPSFVLISATMATMRCAFVTSPSRTSAPPASFAVSSRASRRRPVRTSFAPSFASAIAAARPMPEPPAREPRNLSLDLHGMILSFFLFLARRDAAILVQIKTQAGGLCYHCIVTFCVAGIIPVPRPEPATVLRKSTDWRS